MLYNSNSYSSADRMKSGAVSQRKMRLPRLTDKIPLEIAEETSSCENPPSQPTMQATVSGAGIPDITSFSVLPPSSS